MTLTERVKQITYAFDKLTIADGLNDRRQIVESITEELKDDFYFCLEVLAGRHKLGYTYAAYSGISSNIENYTIRQVYQEILQKPLKMHDLSENNIAFYCAHTYDWREFLEPLCNRKFRLGIGASLLPKIDTSPMLAKKFDGTKIYNGGYGITEKLDGNRCISKFVDGKWEHTSRNGKPMNVEFDMSGLDTTRIYDGEILSPEQVEMSEEIWRVVNEKVPESTGTYASMFNSTSGLINRKGGGKRLVYNIFDIMDENLSYWQRRAELDKYIQIGNGNTRILPLLARFETSKELNEKIQEILYTVTSIGGEGVMINIGGAPYVHKRSNSLLKYKEAKTMDMKVDGTFDGNGKYEMMCGGLICIATLSDGKNVVCRVGTGMSDQERYYWSLHPERIVGSIVEVEYFSLSQDKKLQGTNLYSLRFPRYKKVRTDKATTSEY